MVKNDRPQSEGVNSQKIRELGSEYSIDRQEMGKLLVVVSIVAFLSSVNMIYALQDIEQQVGSASENMSRLTGIVQTERFQSSLQTLRNDNRVGVSEDTNIVANSLMESFETVETLEEAESRTSEYKETYQYVALISVGTTVAGMSLMVM